METTLERIKTLKLLTSESTLVDYYTDLRDQGEITNEDFIGHTTNPLQVAVDIVVDHASDIIMQNNYNMQIERDSWSFDELKELVDQLEIHELINR